MRGISSWGGLSALPHRVVSLFDRNQVGEVIAKGPFPGLAYGMGRSYGDVCLNPQGTLWSTRGLDAFIAFDENSGYLLCEAGVLLKDIQRLLIPQGWMLPVTPGTQMVTVGGAIANDVHGKNHHVAGSFGNHLQHIRLLRTDGQLIDCGPDSYPEWFAATVGGLGLTGVIVQAGIQLCRVAGPWFDTETLPYSNVEEFFELADGSESDWEYTVSWIDCLSDEAGPGVFMRANPSEKVDSPPVHDWHLSMPFSPPCSLVNRFSLRAFNALYYWSKQYGAGRSISHYESFLYPLDRLRHWNRIYGAKGFYQYQNLLPRTDGEEGVKAMLKEVARYNEGAFLAVLKTFGKKQSLGMLSFPREGVSLALDFPNRSDRSLALFERLDAITREAGGRIYPAKDARMPPDLFESGYPRLAEFLKYRDPGISSSLSRRLIGS